MFSNFISEVLRIKYFEVFNELSLFPLNSYLSSLDWRPMLHLNHHKLSNKEEEKAVGNYIFIIYHILFIYKIIK